jgi:hypothetical protein
MSEIEGCIALRFDENAAIVRAAVRFPVFCQHISGFIMDAWWRNGKVGGRYVVGWEGNSGG